MGAVFKKQSTRAVPVGAEIVVKGAERIARWRVRGKLRTAPLTKGTGGADRIVTESATYFAKYRDATGKVVVRPTECRDKQAAEQMLKKWEREGEQIKSGTLDRKALDAARQAAVPLEEHLAAYTRSLIAAEVSDTYRSNVLRAVRCVSKDCGFATPADFDREAVENWMAARIEDGMSARSRNYYRESLIAFANWCVGTGRLVGHDLNRVPKADQKSDPRRQRRSLTEDELKRLLAVASVRPLTDTQTIRRGNRKGQTAADLKPETVARLQALGRERALIYKTLVLTGLRKNELATLTVGQLDLTAGSAFLQLDAADEKSREGNAIAIRDDLADDLRNWLADKLAAVQTVAREAGEPTPTLLPGEALLFDVPSGLVRILDRDLVAAGIPKRDDRGRTVDVHAMRTTFGTLLSKTGTAPRTAQAAMRHSDIKLTMGVYTDTRLLDVRGAVEKLPTLPLTGGAGATTGAITEPRTSDDFASAPNSVAPEVAPTPFRGRLSGATPGTEQPNNEPQNKVDGIDVSADGVNEKPSVTTTVTEGHRVGLIGFEPTTSWSRTKRSSQAELQPVSSQL
ncbi:integrase-recombinase protein : Uncultured bacterium genome assembly Metasoil_fosmids_resub OS=uncultured bacterium PE=4 SV=1: Phage_integrase [Gemmata massiliana]|uniref:Tyr recombinase domain-containing protein n=1 Tax=Gemmata massiliana TaxID=1210884 RepID=A0A6P2CZW4_9BACT|nr:integrase-recombinase protein : Uncultured bacterium genome assembly Metasoil_fosmids_resub OS=uncultured bacterium PE=4 SV=1: Phage_integrase [Gemmata massiliana]